MADPIGWEAFKGAIGSVTTLLAFWFYLGYQQKWIWFHTHEREVAILKAQIAEKDKIIEKLETSERFWMTNAMKSTNIAEQVVGKAVA